MSMTTMVLIGMWNVEQSISRVFSRPDDDGLPTSHRRDKG